jgi:hypothetical protein
LNTETKAKTVKLNTKMNVNLRNIENFENEPIRAKLCRTRSVYEKLIRNTNPQCITINKCHGGKFQCKRVDLSIWFFWQEKKEKERKNNRKIWDAMGTKLDWIVTRLNLSCSLSFGRPNHMGRNNSAALSQMQPCSAVQGD